MCHNRVGNTSSHSDGTAVVPTRLLEKVGQVPGKCDQKSLTVFTIRHSQVAFLSSAVTSLVSWPCLFAFLEGCGGRHKCAPLLPFLSSGEALHGLVPDTSPRAGHTSYCPPALRACFCEMAIPHSPVLPRLSAPTQSGCFTSLGMFC